MSYIKKFESPTDYQSFIGGGEMVKPNVSYVKETNEVHYNSRFAIKFEPGNYYVEEANYLKEINDAIYNKTQSASDYYINEFGDVYSNWSGSNYITNISEESYFSYLKKIILLDKNYNGFIILSNRVLNTNTVYVMYNDNQLDDWGYCDYLEQ